jgi:hypothetical protein
MAAALDWVAVDSTGMFRLPHWAALNRDSVAREGITTDASYSTTLWIGSKDAIQRERDAAYADYV